MMGSQASQAGRGRDEGPQREVSISPFAIGKYEVTFQQWDACLAGGGCNGFSPSDHGWGRGSHPVSGVSYNDAKAYVDWLNAQNPNMHYRLASESEWEYAARAGAAGAYAFEGRLTTHLATFLMQRTTEVGTHGANAYGLFDMYGNVGEWVEDCYAPSYNLAPVDGAAGGSGALRASRLSRRRLFRPGGGASRHRSPRRDPGDALAGRGLTDRSPAKLMELSSIRSGTSGASIAFACQSQCNWARLRQ